MLLFTSKHILKEIIHHGTPFSVVGSTDVLQQLQKTFLKHLLYFCQGELDLD